MTRERKYSNDRSRVFQQRPDTFDAIAASADELRRFGIPPRPDARTSPKLYELWEKAFSKRPRLVEPEYLEGLEVPRRQQLPTHPGVTTFSRVTAPFWCGSGYTRPPSGLFTYVGALWVVPSATAADANHGLLSWVGIDGWGTNAVLQIGTWHRLAGDPPALTVYGWCEWFPAPSVVVSNFPVSPGDALAAFISATSATEGLVTLHNFNTNVHFSQALTPPAGDQFEGKTAEWIVEKPGGTTPIANFGETAMVLAAATYSDAIGGAKLGEVSAKEAIMIDMANAQKQTLAAAQPNATGVTMTYFKDQ